VKKLRIRTFALLCFCFILLLPWLFYIAAHVLNHQSLRFSQDRPLDEKTQRQVDETIRLIEGSAKRWADADWQARLSKRLGETELAADIRSASDEIVYRSDPDTRTASMAAERFSVIEDGRLLGRVVVYRPQSPKLIPMTALFAGLLLAFLIVAFEMRRFLLKPLERLSEASRQVASGDWSIRLPASRIAEIADVRDGFEAMVSGLRHSFRKQRESEEQRRFVIAALAHDLRTPLFALRGYLDGLETGIARSPDKMAHYVAVCKASSAQLDRLVEELFAFAKLEYQETVRSAENVDLAGIVRKSVESLSPAARQKRIAMVTRIADDGDCAVNGDPLLLERALNNILDNAVRHTPEGGEIMVVCQREGDQAHVRVSDTGPGFQAEELERVFEPLYRGEASRNRSTGGSGLGLTIARTIFRQHGGELAASNRNREAGGALLEGRIPAVSAAD